MLRQCTYFPSSGRCVHVVASDLHSRENNGRTIISYAAKVLVQQLHVAMQHFQAQQLILLVFQTDAEIQTGIPTIEANQEQ